MIAEATNALFIYGLIYSTLYLFRKIRCLRKKALTVARIPQGPPLFWNIPYCIFLSK